MTEDYRRIHRDSIVIDATCPLLSHQDYFNNWMAGGATAAAATVGLGVPEVGTPRMTIRNMGQWFRKIADNPEKLLLVLSAEDIHRAKAEGKLGIIFHFQGTMPFEDDLNSIAVFHRLGLRMVQLCYNTADLAGCGCSVPQDTGLTAYGREIIAELNRLGIVVDCAHTGMRTTMEAIEASSAPVIISHGNARSVHGNSRNLPDEVILAIAEKGGTIGLNGYPAFVASGTHPTLDDLLDHADHIMTIAGPDHVSLGIDYFEYQAGVVDDATARLVYDYLLQSGAWAPGEYPPPPWNYPQGIEMPEKLPNLTAGLLARGYSEKDVEKILGLNLMRVFSQVWPQVI